MMYYTWFLCFIAGSLSAIHSDGHLFSSPKSFVYFVAYMTAAIFVGEILDNYRMLK